MAFTTLLHV